MKHKQQNKKGEKKRKSNNTTGIHSAMWFNFRRIYYLLLESNAQRKKKTHTHTTLSEIWTIGFSLFYLYLSLLFSVSNDGDTAMAMQ